MEAKHIKVVKCSDQDCKIHLDNTLGMDEYDLSDYYNENRLIDISGSMWKYVKSERLDPDGFTHIVNKTNDSCEMIVLFYNGGASKDEVVQWAFE